MDKECFDFEERLSALFKLVQEKYVSNLPSNYTPPPHEFRLASSGDPFQKLCKSLLDAEMENGVLLNVNLSVYELEIDSPLYFRKIYFELLEYICRKKSPGIRNSSWSWALPINYQGCPKLAQSVQYIGLEVYDRNFLSS